MAIVDKNYHNLLEKIIQEGYTYEDPNRKGVNRIEIPSYTFRHEFKDGFPTITTKKLNYKSVVTELIWFLRGDTNIKYLVDNGCNIWNKDAYNYYKKHIYPEDSLDFNDFVDFIKNQMMGNNYSTSVEEQIKTMQGSAGAAGSSSSAGGHEVDVYFADAGRFVIEKDKASIGMLQRLFKIGFNRAARIVDQLEEAGVVSAEEGTKPRKVLMSLEQFENYLDEVI